METDTEVTSDTQTGTQDTVGSSELNAEEAEAISRSMDMSMEFWGQSQDPPEKIPATRLKCAITSGKASNIALKIWDKMTQRDLEKVKEIEVVLMKEGEIGTLDLLNALRYIIEGTGLDFEEVLKSVGDDPLESTISVTNEILSIFNQNEPPEIVEDDDYNSYMRFQPSSAKSNRSGRKREITNRIKYLLNRAEKLGLSEIKVPSSPYLTERSKLSLVEKQMKAKMRLKSVQQAFRRTEQVISDRHSQEIRYSRKKMSSFQKREHKRSTLADRPTFRTAVKAETQRYGDLIRRAPDLHKRMKKVNEMRKKLLEKSKNNSEGKKTNSIRNIQSIKSHHFVTPYNFNGYSHSFKARSSKQRKRFLISSMSNCGLGDYDSESSVSNAKINITIENNDVMTNERDSLNHASKFQRMDRPPSREDMLLEMKKMLKEAVQEVAMSSTLIQPTQIATDHKKEKCENEMTDEQTQNDNESSSKTQSLTADQKCKNETSIATVYKKKNNEDTIVTVTQEGLSPFRQTLNANDENKVSTEVKVSKSYGGQGLKVSVTSKLSGNENEHTEFLRPRNKQQDVQEAINVLKEYISLNNNENHIQDYTDHCQKEEVQSMMINISVPDEIIDEQSITTETVTTTEVVIETNTSDNKERVTEMEEETKSTQDRVLGNKDSPAFQAYAVTMLMPVGTPGEMRPYSPFQMGGVVLNSPYNRWMANEVDDTGDAGWSPWDSPVWTGRDLDEEHMLTRRNDCDSLYVNTSEEVIHQNITTDECSSIQSETTVSTTSLITTNNDVDESRRNNAITNITNTIFELYRYIMTSILRVFGLILNPLNPIKYFKTNSNNDGNRSS